MKQSVLLLAIVGMFSIAQQGVYAQGDKNSQAGAGSGCSMPTPRTLKSQGQLSDDQESRYRSPIRYAIVYNEIGPTDDRRIDLLMNAANINEKDLRTIFCWIGERYPSPVTLTINVHTSLATIETPDERELLHDGDGSRFSKYYDMHRRANYARFDSGREAFGYTISLSPYREKQVVIRDAK